MVLFDADLRFQELWDTEPPIRITIYIIVKH